MNRKNQTAPVLPAARIAADILVLIAVVFVVVAFAQAAQASMPAQKGATSLRGEIVAVDNLGYTTVLTVLSPQIGRFPNNEMNIFTNGKTMTRVCSAREPARDVHVDSTAAITYHETGGVAVANTVSERC